MHPQIDVHEWIFISLYWYTIKIKIPHYSTRFRCISRGSVQFGMAYRSELQVCVFLKWQFQRNLFVLFVIYSLEAECMYSLSQHGAQNRPHFDSCAFNRLTWLAKSISLVRCKRVIWSTICLQFLWMWAFSSQIHPILKGWYVHLRKPTQPHLWAWSTRHLQRNSLSAEFQKVMSSRCVASNFNPCPVTLMYKCRQIPRTRKFRTEYEFTGFLIRPRQADVSEQV